MSIPILSIPPPLSHTEVDTIGLFQGFALNSDILNEIHANTSV